MNRSAIAACALVACETEFLVRRVAGAFGLQRISHALQRVGIWVVPPAPVPARVKSRGLGPRWHLLLAIVAAAGTIALDPAAVYAQSCGGFGSCGSCGSGCGGPSFFGSPCGGPSFFGSPCGGSPCCGSPCGRPMPFFGRPCGGCQPSCCRPACQPMGCCGGCSSGCGCQRYSFAAFPGAGCGPVCGPRCGPSCGSPCGSPCGCPCGPSCGLACGPACGCGMPGCGVGGCGAGGSGCGPVAGTPAQTFEGAPSGPLPSSSNKAGPPPSIDPGDLPPGGPPTRSNNAPARRRTVRKDSSVSPKARSIPANRSTCRRLRPIRWESSSNAISARPSRPAFTRAWPLPKRGGPQPGTWPAERRLPAILRNPASSPAPTEWTARSDRTAPTWGFRPQTLQNVHRVPRWSHH